MGESEEIDGGVAEGGQVVTSSGVLDAATVFLPEGVTDPMDAILDAPMTSPEREQLGGVDAAGREAGDRVLHFFHELAVAQRLSLQSADLGEPRPGESRRDPRAGLQTTAHAPAVFFGMRGRGGDVRVALTLSGGGKIPAENRRRSRL